MNFALALAIAVNFWGARGVEVPCTPVPVSGADALMGTDRTGLVNAMEAAPGCRILISTWASPVARNGAPEWYCGYVAHEVGHLAGLRHGESGPMREDLFWDDLPWECVHWRYAAKRYGIKLNRPRLSRS